MKKKRTVFMMILLLVIILGMSLNFKSLAETSEISIVLGDEDITVDGEKIGTETTNSIYSTQNTDSNSDVTNGKEYTVVNIREAGTYRISGTMSNGQIAVDAGDNDEINLILDGVDITCETAPAIIIYNALDEKKAGDAGVTITLADHSENNITGSHIPKKASYTVNGEKKSYEAKYDGAISSDVSLILTGNGKAKIKADNEGIEVKLHLTVNGGNFQIDSDDDAINANEE